MCVCACVRACVRMQKNNMNRQKSRTIKLQKKNDRIPLKGYVSLDFAPVIKKKNVNIE